MPPANPVDDQRLRFAVIVSADAEWQPLKQLFPAGGIQTSPNGEFFYANVDRERVPFFQGGWGKVAAAGSTQYLIDHFRPARLINLGTCGGVENRIRHFDLVAVERVVIYDIAEAIGDPEEAIATYSTSLALPAPLPVPVLKATMYSADRDLTPADLLKFNADGRPVVADWESGAIAWVAQRNAVPVLILRGVTDLVSPQSAEAQGNLPLLRNNTILVMQKLVADLPQWLAAWR